VSFFRRVGPTDGRVGPNCWGTVFTVPKSTKHVQPCYAALRLIIRGKNRSNYTQQADKPLNNNSHNADRRADCPMHGPIVKCPLHV
jgi:hypothetical protein